MEVNEGKVFTIICKVLSPAWTNFADKLTMYRVYQAARAVLLRVSDSRSR